MKRIPAILLLLSISATVVAYDLPTGRENALGGNLLLSRPTATDLVNFSAGSLGAGDWRLETGFVRTFDLSDLDQGFFSVAGRYRGFTLAGGFSQLGQRDFYAERTAKLALAVHYDSLAIGITGSYLHLSFGQTYAPLSGFGVGFSGAWRRGKWLVGAAADNVNSPKLYTGAVPNRPLYSSLVELRTRSTLSTLARVTVQKMERPRYSLGQRIGLGKNGAFMWGIRTAPITYGGGLELAIGQTSLAYAALYHPVLGMTQTISVSIGSRHTRESGDDEFDR